MQLSCAYIESIVMGNYDEMGYVNLQNNWDGESTPQWVHDNMYANEFSHAVTDVSPLQVFFLLFTILACIILAVWSKTLHSSLTKKELWSPRRHWNARSNIFRRQDKHSGISPADSGIEASRVRSDGTSYYVS